MWCLETIKQLNKPAHPKYNVVLGTGTKNNHVTRRKTKEQTNTTRRRRLPDVSGAAGQWREHEVSPQVLEEVPQG